MATQRDKSGKVTSTRRNPRRRSLPAGVKRYRVAEGTQVNHDGKVYAEGETLEVPAARAFDWVVAGVVEQVGK